jgi:hypothetical protein
MTMTDLLTDSASVGTESHTARVATALTVPRDEEVVAAVSKFGFEYEMFPHEQGNYYDHDDVWDDDHERCNCSDCLDSRLEDLRNADKPVQAESLIIRAKAHDLIVDADMHNYHCRCGTCSPTRSWPLMTAQEDGTVGVEFVSRIIDVSCWDVEAVHVNAWVAMMNAHKSDGGWMPDGDTSCGNHVHVSSSGMDDGRTFGWGEATKRLAYRHINAMYAVFDWTDVADGGCGRIRGYNSKPGTKGGSGSYLNDRGYGTFEHRLWNTPAIPERLYAHIGLSIAIQRWAFALVKSQPDFTFWNESTRWGDPAMSDGMYAAIKACQGLFLDQINQYLPDFAEFSVARDVLGNLRSMSA